MLSQLSIAAAWEGEVASYSLLGQKCPQTGPLTASTGPGFWLSGHQGCPHSLACMGGQALEVHSPSRSCLGNVPEKELG